MVHVNRSAIHTKVSECGILHVLYSLGSAAAWLEYNLCPVSASTRPPPHSWCLAILTGSHHSWRSANSIKKTCQLHCLWRQRSSCAWEHEWRQEKSDLPATVAATMKVVDEALFPNITRALRILATIPVTSCECERVVSGLRNLKTYLHSTTQDNRLPGLAMMHVHYTRETDPDTIIQNFAIQHLRRWTRSICWMIK